MLETRNRKGLPPEHQVWKDTGCKYFAACLECPFSVCLYEDTRGAKVAYHEYRDRAIRKAVLSDSVERVAERFGMSTRNVYRLTEILQRDKRRMEAYGQLYVSNWPGRGRQEYQRWMHAAAVVLRRQGVKLEAIGAALDRDHSSIMRHLRNLCGCFPVRGD